MSDPSSIYNFRRFNDRITTSGQPTEQQLAGLTAIGVTHVVNLGLHSHDRALVDEAASLARLGIGYTHIPVEFDRPTEADFVAFRDVMTMFQDVTLHVHCIANMRVSAFLYRWRREFGDENGKARALMDSVWQPGGVWATLIGEPNRSDQPHGPPLRPWP